MLQQPATAVGVLPPLGLLALRVELPQAVEEVLEALLLEEVVVVHLLVALLEEVEELLCLELVVEQDPLSDSVLLFLASSEDFVDVVCTIVAADAAGWRRCLRLSWALDWRPLWLWEARCSLGVSLQGALVAEDPAVARWGQVRVEVEEAVGWPVEEEGAL